MVNDAELFEPKDTEKIGDYVREWFVVSVECAGCHQRREFGNLFIRRRVGIMTTIGKLKERLRCHQCGTRRGVVKVVRLSR